MDASCFVEKASIKPWSKKTAVHLLNPEYRTFRQHRRNTNKKAMSAWSAAIFGTPWKVIRLVHHQGHSASSFLCLFACFCICFRLSVCLSVCVLACLLACLLHVCVCWCLCVCAFVCLLVCLPVCLFVCLFVCVSMPAFV